MRETPEQRARLQIDDQLSAAGWAVQDLPALNLAAARGVAVREMQSQGDPADYVLFIDGKALGVVEAKKKALPCPALPTSLNATPTLANGSPSAGPIPCLSPTSPPALK